VTGRGDKGRGGSQKPKIGGKQPLQGQRATLEGRKGSEGSMLPHCKAKVSFTRHFLKGSLYMPGKQSSTMCLGGSQQCQKVRKGCRSQPEAKKQER